MSNLINLEKKYGAVCFEGQKFVLTDSAEFTNRLLPSCNTNFNEVEDGEEYNFEMSAPAIDVNRNKYTAYWIFTDIKGEEWNSEKFDWEIVDRVEVD